MYKPILVILHTGSTGYVYKSKCKVFGVKYMKFNVCLSCSIHDFYIFVFSFRQSWCVIPRGQCARSISLETWLRPTALKKKIFQNKIVWLCHTEDYTPYFILSSHIYFFFFGSKLYLSWKGLSLVPVYRILPSYGRLVHQ